MNKLLIITGPTAVGKTEVSIELAHRLDTEIISADSMQIYKGMDIGSAKVKEEEMSGILHHLINIIDPMDEYSVAQYKKDALSIINNLHTKGKVPIIAGGTGLYINSLICNYSFGETYKDEGYRQYLEELAREKGNNYVHSLLKDIDSISYEKLHPNNLKRVIRALEVYRITGKPISQEHNLNNIYDVPFDIYYYVLTINRQKLYEKINLRVDIMLKEGLLDEVKQLYKRGLDENMQSMKGIGYKELLLYIKGVVSLEKAVDMIKQGSRNYAKRQLTWFRKDPRAIWIDKDDYLNNEEIIKRILKDINK